MLDREPIVRKTDEALVRSDFAEAPETLQKKFESLTAEYKVFSTIHNPKTGKESRVVDEEALRASIDALFEKDRSWGEKLPKPEVMEMLPHVVGDSPVLVSAQVERGEYGEKPFFYVPKNIDAATDTMAIKNAEFHRFVSDFLPFLREHAAYPVQQSSKDDQISSLEAKVAALIFHPGYGDGYRNERGELIVRDPKTRKYKRFSGGFFDIHGVQDKEFMRPRGAQSHGSTTEYRSMREGMVAELPHMVKKGLVDPVRDLRQMTHGRKNMEGQRIERVGVTKTGSRHFNGVIHYIGREFYGKDIRLVQISPTLGAVVNMSSGVERVTHTFNIVSRDGEGVIRGKSNMYLANKEIVQTQPFSAESVALPQRADESREQYLDRTEKTNRGLAHLLLNVFPKHPELANMLRDNPLYEQASIAQAAYLLERDGQTERFDEFVEQYGEAGARTFLVTANDDSLRDKIFDFAEKVPQEDAQRVFEAYGRVIDSVDNLNEYLREQFGSGNESAVGAVTSKIFQRARDLLSSAYERKDDPERIIELIDSVRAGTQLFVDACRVLKESEELSLENVSGATLEVARGSELKDRPEETAEMLSIQREHYARKYKGEMLRSLVVSLAEALASENSRFYIYKVDGKIAAFLRFDDEFADVDGNRVLTKKHFASVMTNPAFSGGKLGEALIELALEREKEAGVPIYAECDPPSAEHTTIAEKYIELGFKAIGSRYDDGEPTLDIVLNPSQEKTVAQTLSKQNVIQYAKQHTETPTRRFYARETPPDFENALRNGWELTRYFKEKENGANVHYAVFERVPESRESSREAA